MNVYEQRSAFLLLLCVSIPHMKSSS